MVRLKTDEEIELIRKSGDLLGRAHGEIAKVIRPGVRTEVLDRLAEEYIRDSGGEPSFKGFHGFPATLCVSVNDVVVHGFPGSYELRETDIVTVDCGVILDGWYSDSAYTYPLEGAQPEVLALLERTYQSLYIGIAEVKPGNRTGDIGFAIQQYIDSFGYGIVRELVGHGVGHGVHEDPEVPNYGKRGKGVKLVNGMVFAIEPMINLGKRGVVQERDGWTIRTIDRKPSAHFEHTVALKNGQAEILTTFEHIEKNYEYAWRSKSR